VTGNSSSRIVRFSIFDVNLHTGELRKAGQKVKLQEQPLQVLTALLERPGELVTREELRAKLWAEDTFVDFDHSLNAAIKRLRDALGESAETPIFVETIPRKGYRFIGNVERSLAITPKPRHRLLTASATLVVGLALFVVALAFLYYRYAPTSKASLPAITPIVTNTGEKHNPSLSPDGQHLAFAWNGGAGFYHSLYVKLVGTEEPLRLTRQASIDFNPVWSPDGRYIAFCRIQKGGTGIYTIPALGGAERIVRKTLWEYDPLWEHAPFVAFWFWKASLSWSPDGKFLAYSDHPSRGENASIFLLSLDSLEVRKLTSPTRSNGDFNPEISPDGQTLAFIRASQSIYTIAMSGGKEHLLFSNNRGKNGLAWTPDSRALVFTNGWPTNGWGLWKISLRGGDPERLQVGQDGVEPSIRGNRLAYVQRITVFNIWKRRLHSSGSAESPDKLLPSTRMQSGPQFSPDGTRIAFESTRSGTYEIWVCQSDGSRLMQLTNFGPSEAGTPRWSPDGQQIVFDRFSDENADIYVVDSQGGAPRKLTKEPSNEAVPSWSRDGGWIYFASDRTGGWEVWKMPSTGGQALQVTRHGGFAAFESPDGKYLYYAKRQLPGLWRIPTNGGEEVEVIRSFASGNFWGYWAVVDNGIYYLDLTDKPRIAFFDSTTHRSTPLFDLESGPAKSVAGLAISPDKGTILYTQVDGSSSEIILVENFR
jgi:Tol biopolymer transport system component/DNA-binding winged helix-turn-helix (wHTH) protein